jgi:hypothetical protein
MAAIDGSLPAPWRDATKNQRAGEEADCNSGIRFAIKGISALPSNSRAR